MTQSQIKNIFFIWVKNNLQNITNLQMALVSAGIGLTAGLLISWYTHRNTISELELKLLKTFTNKKYIFYLGKELTESENAFRELWSARWYSEGSLAIPRTELPQENVEATNLTRSDSGDTVTQSDYYSLPSLTDSGIQTDYHSLPSLTDSGTQTDSVTLVDSGMQTDEAPTLLNSPTASNSSIDTWGTIGSGLGTRFRQYSETGVQTEYRRNNIGTQTGIQGNNVEIQTEFQGNNAGIQTELTPFSRISSYLSNLVRTQTTSSVHTANPIETPTTDHVEIWRLRISSFNPSPISEGRAASIAERHRSVSELGSDEEVTSSAVRSYEPVSYESTVTHGNTVLPVPNREMGPVSPSASTVSDLPLPIPNRDLGPVSPSASISSELPLPIPNRDLLPVNLNSGSVTPSTVSELPLPIPNVEMETATSIGEQLNEVVEIVTGSSQPK